MKEMLKKNWAFIIVLTVFVIYYLYRLFAITPWYDELYTYINFIDKGALYSITHWPAPNNHIFFSFISCLLKVFGEYVTLRGISYLSALGTMILLYTVMKDILSEKTAALVVIVYSLFPLVNTIAIQGRGYSLATFFLMLSIYAGYHICFKKDQRKFYILWAVSLYLGLYTLMSSVYWVLSVCLCFGILLFIFKKWKKLIRLIVSSIIAAVATFGSYCIMWMALGGQRLVEVEYPGESVFWTAIRHPRASLLWGLNFMMNDRNMQSIDRSAFIHDFKYFARDILCNFIGVRSIPATYTVIAVVLLMLVAFVVAVIFIKKKKSDIENAAILLPLIIGSIGIIGIYLCLLVQSVYPFERVFSFMGIFFVCISGMILYAIKHVIGKLPILKITNILYPAAYSIALVCCVYYISSAGYNNEYSGYDYWALDALEYADMEDDTAYLAADTYVEQQIQYHCIIGDKIKLTEDVESPDVIFVLKGRMSGSWPYIISVEEYNALEIEKRELIYENEMYCVYE